MGYEISIKFRECNTATYSTQQLRDIICNVQHCSYCGRGRVECFGALKWNGKSGGVSTTLKNVNTTNGRMCDCGFGGGAPGGFELNERPPPFRNEHKITTGGNYLHHLFANDSARAII